MIRNMTDIAKAQFLVITLTKEATEAEVEFKEHLEAYKCNLQNCMESASTLFSAAARNRLFATLARYCETRVAQISEDPYGNDVTVYDLKTFIANHWSYLNVLPRSTSGAHNLAEAYLSQAIIDFMRDSHRFDRWFSDAQERDPEFCAWATAESERRKQAAAAKAEAEMRELKARENARQRVRAALARVKHGTGSAPAHEDLLLGWPTTYHINDIRSDTLREWVKNAHEKEMGIDGAL